MGVTTIIASAGLALGVAMGTAGCASVAPETVVTPVVSPTSPQEGTPAVALLYLSGDPAVAGHGVELRLDDRLGGPGTPIRIEPGERIVVQLGLQEGVYRLGETHGACALDIDLVGGLEVDVLMTHGDAGSCALEVTGRHEPDTAEHPLFGAVSVTFPVDGTPDDLAVHLRSLDSPPNPVPGPGGSERDRPGQFTVFDVPQGTYEVQVTGGGNVLGSAEIVVGTGPASEPHVTIVPASPRPAG